MYISSCLSPYYDLNVSSVSEVNLIYLFDNTPMEISTDLNNIETILRYNG